MTEEQRERDFHVLLSGASHIHRATEPPKVGGTIPLDGDRALVTDSQERPYGTVYVAERVRD